MWFTEATSAEATHGGQELFQLRKRRSAKGEFGGGQEGVRRVDPKLRQFSELRRWLQANAHQQLAGRKVLMYCTGGVRCERASAMLRSLGPPFQDVLQLQGLPPLPSTHPEMRCPLLKALSGPLSTCATEGMWFRLAAGFQAYLTDVKMLKGRQHCQEEDSSPVSGGARQLFVAAAFSTTCA